MDIHFTYEQKKILLKAWGLTIKKIEVEFSESVYHNDTREWKETVEGVFKKGKAHCRPFSYSFGKQEWVNRAFSEELPKKLFTLLKTAV